MRVAIISPQPPELCGIANFAAHLGAALVSAGDLTVEPVVVRRPGAAASDEAIRKDHIKDYRRAADRLNESRPDVVLLQHEYGLFGGSYGDYVLALARRLDLPLVTVLHTVLPHPNDALRKVTAELIARSSLTAVTCRSALALLQTFYGAIGPIEVFRHGYPRVGEQPCPKQLPRRSNNGGPILLALGLLGPDKGIEKAISAMPVVRAHLPGATLWIVGRTHPGELRNGVDMYRKQLNSAVRRHHLDDAVFFLDDYLGLEEHVGWIQHTDLVLTLHRDLRQVSSGTLTYAIGFGRAAVSTPFLYAQELASEGAGVVMTEPDASNAAEVIVSVLSDSWKYHRLMAQSYELAPSLTWQAIAEVYRQRFAQL
jgi:glycosyltransferase involved in cell wall biosynthesis